MQHIRSDKELIDAAQAVRKNAYAPYSKFRVGTALLGAGGGIFCGANIENVSLGLTICAERIAVGNAIVAGENKFEKIAIVTDFAEPVVPCGACRQVLAEFNPALVIISSTLGGATARFRLDELLPKSNQSILG